MMVVRESTTYPGTTEELIKPILESSGLKCGEDFYLGFSPERVDPGNVYFKTTQPEQNLNRARVQFRLCESVEARERSIRSVLKRL